MENNLKCFQLIIRDLAGGTYYSKVVPNYQAIQFLIDEINQDEFGFVEYNDGKYINRKYVSEMKVIMQSLKGTENE